jgi:hypothetical protein
MEEASASGSHQEEEEDILGPIYDDTKGFIDKGTSVKWGEVFQMFKNQFFPKKQKMTLISKSSGTSGSQNYIGWQPMQQYFHVQTQSHG